jgi:hypothetical protein
MIHPMIKEPRKPATKKTHTPKENGGKNVESFSNAMKRLIKEMNPRFESLREEFVEFFICLSLFMKEVRD